MKCASITLYLTATVLVAYVNGDASTENGSNNPGYYWRNYTGKVPTDAIPGGTDSNGKTTYIGITWHSAGSPLLPGVIHKSHGKIVYEYGYGEHTRTEDVKILCSQHPERLQWISTTKWTPITSVGNDKHLILGGSDSSRPLAIGRTTTATGEVTVGKVLIIHNKFEFLHLATNGNSWYHGGPYEVLVYNPTVSAEDKKKYFFKK